MKRLAETLDAVRSTRSRKEKLRLLAALFSSLDEPSLRVAARLVDGRLLPATDPRTVGVGWALALSAAARASGKTEREVALRSREVGDFGDALADLMTAPARVLSLAELPAAVEALVREERRDGKLTQLTHLFKQVGPREARYLAKALLGELRIGVQRGTLEEALAQAFAIPLEVLRRAAAVTPDAGELAARAKQGTLSEAAIVVGNVVAFMLATPIEQVKQPIDATLTVVEEKLDGVRAQAHVRGEEVRLFARGQGEVTRAFPEVVEQLRRLSRPTVLDGEIIAVAPDGRARPFQALQARLGRSRAGPGVRANVPVAYVVFDLLVDGEPVVSLPWSERRRRLEALPLRINPVTPLDASSPLDAQLDALFTQARARGNEGLMLKRTDASYEAGHRGSAWRKVKRAYATLDVVITRAERGHGKRAGVLSDYTFAVWRGAELAEIGKAYSGLTDVEIAALTTRLEAITLKHVGPYRWVKPLIVLEVAFDGVQRSDRHDSGFALRFPRILRLRDDKEAREADTLDAVRALFDSQVETGHREPPKQLGLFD